MFDRSVRSLIDPLLNAAGRNCAAAGVSANMVTWAGFGLAAIAALLIAQDCFLSGLLILLLSRICDGLDGAVARVNGTGSGTDLGGFLDIVLDFAFYGMIPFAFILADPASNAVAGSLLILVFYVNGASFLAFALLAEKRGIDPRERGSKSLLYTAGLAEATETIVFFALCCLLPQWFAQMSFAFSAVVVITTISRFVFAYRTFD